jgi:hypothetical protein
MLRVNVAGVDLLGAHISQDADFCAEFVLKPVRKIEAFLKRSNSPMISICNSSKCVPVWGLRALTLLCAALTVNAIAAFDKAMLDTMEVIWNRYFSESQRKLACLPIKSGGVGLCPRLAHLCRLSKTKSRPPV